MANPYFNAKYYRDTNPDLAKYAMTDEQLEQHYVQYGATDGRLPNDWFDAQAYLQLNPDLLEAGIGLGGALNHFAQYGIYEGRDFSFQIDLQMSNFTADTYAEENPDVAAFFGITDVDALTTEQEGQLLSHYIQYGRAQERAGSGFPEDAFDAAITVDNDGMVTTGTNGNDTFNWTAASPNEDGSAVASVYGLAGIDTLNVRSLAESAAIQVNSIENIIVRDVTGDASLNVLGSGVQSLNIAAAAEDSSLTYTGAKVGSVSLNALADVDLAFNNVDGEADQLDVTIGTAASNASQLTGGLGDVADAGFEGTGGLDLSAAASLTTHGIETVNVTLPKGDAVLVLDAAEVDGDSLTVTVTGGTAETDTVLGSDAVVIVGSTGPVDEDGAPVPGYGLENVTVDGSAYLGNQLIVLHPNLSANGDLTVSLTGGAGDDYLVANAGIDTLTGGAGNDTFIFADGTAVVDTGTDGKISAVDSIADFAKGDVVQYNGMVVIDGGPIGDVGTVTNGMLKFNTAFEQTSLTDIVTAITSALDGVPEDGNTVVFGFQNETYLLVDHGGLADAGLINLGGVNMSQLAFGADGLAFA